MFISTNISSVAWNSKLPVFSVTVRCQEKLNSTWGEVTSETYFYPCSWSKFKARNLLLYALSVHIKRSKLFDEFNIRTECWNEKGDTVVWDIEEAPVEV